MSHKLTPGPYRIVSRIEGNRAIGIDFTLPAFKPVRIDMPIQDWILKRDGKTILLGIGGYQYTGVIGDKVAAFTYPEEEQKWVFTYRQNGFTIAPANDPSKGWTLPPGDDVPEGAAIEIKPLLEAVPGIYFDNQLFNIVRLGE